MKGHIENTTLGCEYTSSYRMFTEGRRKIKLGISVLEPRFISRSSCGQAEIPGSIWLKRSFHGRLLKVVSGVSFHKSGIIQSNSNFSACRRKLTLDLTESKRLGVSSILTLV